MKLEDVKTAAWSYWTSLSWKSIGEQVIANAVWYVIFLILGVGAIVRFTDEEFWPSVVSALLLPLPVPAAVLVLLIVAVVVLDQLRRRARRTAALSADEHAQELEQIQRSKSEKPPAVFEVNGINWRCVALGGRHVQGMTPHCTVCDRQLVTRRISVARGRTGEGLHCEGCGTDFGLVSNSLSEEREFAKRKIEADLRRWHEERGR